MYNTQKKSIIALLAATLVMVTTFGIAQYDPAQAASTQIKIYVDEKPITTDVPPYMKNNRTMVPIRFVSEALGAEVSWNALTQGVTIKSSKTTIKMTIGLLKGWVAKLSGADTETTYDMAPEERNGRTFVPLRFVSENLGATVKWDGNTNTVNIYSEGFVPTEKPVVEGKKVGEFTVPATIVEMPGVKIQGPELAILINIQGIDVKQLNEDKKTSIVNMFASKYGSATGTQVRKMLETMVADGYEPDYDIPGTKDHISMGRYGDGVIIEASRY